jgi:solute carrier family 13 (sodium-dependent dicarboxylate transporter), member 2/3/5
MNTNFESPNPPYVKLAGFIAGISLFIFFLANPMDLPAKAAGVAAIASLMACFWISVCIPIPVTSILPIALFPLLGIAASRDVVKFYADDNIYLFMGGFIIALSLQKWGLQKRIALLVALLVGTSPKRLVLGFFIATALLSMLISNTATAMMMFPIALAIIAQTSELTKRKDENFALALMLAVAYGASIGGIATPIGTPPNIVFLGQFREAFSNAPKITFFSWSVVFLPLVIIFIPVAWWIVTRIVARPKEGATAGREIITGELKKLGRMQSPEFRILTIFTMTVLLWVFRQPINLEIVTIPGWSQIFGKYNFISDATVAVAMAILLFITPSGNKIRKADNANVKQENLGDVSGSFLMDWKTATRLPWGILLLFGGGFAIAGGFKESGLDVIVGQSIRPLLNIHPIFVVAIICTLVTYLTELTSNTATTAALLPIMVGISKALGLNPLLLMIPATISASCAFMLPVATPPNAIIFSSGYVPMSKMIKAGMIMNIVGILLVTLWSYFVVLPAWGQAITAPNWIIK